MECDAIRRLEAWKHGHKARSVSMHIDDGYGASCWMVELHGRDNKSLAAAEVAFLVPTPESLVVPAPDGDDWPGLAKTIHAALDRAELLGL